MALPKNRNKTAKTAKTAKRVKKPRAACQCYDIQTGKGCTRLPVDGTLFCVQHQNCPGSPLSGSEPIRDTKYYNKQYVRKSHNCYSYAMFVHDPKGEELCKKYGNCRDKFHQPGAKTGHRDALNKEERRSCDVVENLMMGDIPEVTKSTFQARCPVGTSKVAAVVDKGVDYHWYRQDRDGYWSHKDGSNKVKDYDALKRRIFNPELASRDYRWQGSDLNYEDVCGFYCVPRDRPVVLGRGVNGPKSRRLARLARREARTAKKKQQRGGQHEVALPILMQTGSAQGGRGLTRRRGGGYDIRLDSLPGCPLWGPTVPLSPQAGGRKTRRRSGGGYDIRLNSLPSCPPQSGSGSLEPQGGMGLSWSNYPAHSTNSLRKQYSLGTKTLRHRRN